MGLNVGTITIEYDVPQPDGAAYQFAAEMAAEGASDAYMLGEGRSWVAFTQRHVLRMLDNYVRANGLSLEERREVLEWINSLPWEGRGNPRSPHGGGIELYFDW